MALNTNFASSATPGLDPAERGTAVDALNSDIERLTSRAANLARFANRIANGITGVQPQPPEAAATPRPVIQSTQDHVRELAGAIDLLDTQLQRLS